MGSGAKNGKVGKNLMVFQNSKELGFANSTIIRILFIVTWAFQILRDQALIAQADTKLSSDVIMDRFWNLYFLMILSLGDQLMHFCRADVSILT